MGFGDNDHAIRELMRFIKMTSREFDEDITCLDTTILATFDSQVKQSFTMIVFDTFDELMMHHDVCSLSFFKNTYMDQKEC